MPLVTDLWFIALMRKMIWRGVFMLSTMYLFGCAIMSPIIWLSIDKFGLWWRFSWLLASTLSVVSAWRWAHWHRTMKANVFDEADPRLKAYCVWRLLG